MFWNDTTASALHRITPFYLLCPNMLSLVGEPLLEDGCGSPNHICF